MRLRERDKKTVYLRRRTGTDQNEHLDTIVLWGEAVQLRAVHQPAGGSIDAQIYGDRLRSMRTMYYDGPEIINAADGFCLNVEPTEAPDYRVSGPPQEWQGHVVVQLEFVSPERRDAP
jgi:hypothetical protein